MKLLICIVGGSGSGKSTLEDDIIIHDGFSKAISTTTREKREGEHDGREYHFVDSETFDQMDNNNKLLESVEFAGNKYGLSKDEFHKNKDHLVFVVEPNGLSQILNYVETNELDITPIVIYMDIKEKDRFKNMVKRGDNPIAIQERLKAETIVEDFEAMNINPNIVVSALNEKVSEEVLKDIYEIIRILEED